MYGKIWRTHERKELKERAINKDVQAYLLNRLVVLALKVQVLSDKVKGLYFQLYERNKLW